MTTAPELPMTNPNATMDNAALPTVIVAASAPKSERARQRAELAALRCVAETTQADRMP